VSLQGRVAIVTGAGRGIGRAVALALAEFGCAVALAARTESELLRVAGEVAERGGRPLPLPADVGVEADARRLVEATVAAFGELHVVVNNAGAVCRARLVEHGVAEWDAVLNSHVRGMFLVTRVALPHLLAAEWGRIVTISSMAGMLGVSHRVAYCTAKWGQRGFTAALDEELRGTGVRAHVLCPGPVATRMRAEGFPEEDPDSLLQPEDVAREAIHLLTLSETAYVREVALQPAQAVRYRDPR
jgi:NAD(P)-dependent dehydrogenase (short-subunit alcohol dehydrogenase family)